MVKFLIDTDILVSLVTGGEENLEIHSYSAVGLERIVKKNRGALYVHPQSFEEVDLKFEGERAVQIKEQMAAYDLIDAPRPLSVFEQKRVGVPKKGSSEYVENALLAAVKAGLVDFLVTEKISLHTRANHLGLATQVLFLSDALGLVRDLFAPYSQTRPLVEKIPFASIDELDPVFWTMAIQRFSNNQGQGQENGMNQVPAQYIKQGSYQDNDQEHKQQEYKQNDDSFNTLLAQLRAKGGDTFVIRDGEKSLRDGDKSLIAGICTVEEEEEGLFIRLFHVINPYPVSQYAALLFKAILDRDNNNGWGQVSFSKFPGCRKIIALAQSLGFAGDNPISLPKISFKENNTWVLPLTPLNHGTLFPEHESQLSLFPCFGPMGNPIEKVCLLPGDTTAISPGDNIFIYRTKGPSAITAMGVVKETLVCSRPDECIRFLGQGTPWNYREIDAFCRKKNLLIKFCHVKNFNPPLALETLKESGVLKGSPRKMVRVKGSGIDWLSRFIAPCVPRTCRL